MAPKERAPKPAIEIDDDTLRTLIDLVVTELDYDLAKQLDEETAELPHLVEPTWARLLQAARKAL